MKFSLFTQYGAMNSQPVFQSLEKGLDKLGHKIVKNDKQADVLVIWSVLWHGRMKSNQEIWNFAHRHQIPILVLEVGGLRRGYTWKLGLNHMNNLATFPNKIDLDTNRPEKLGIFLKNRSKLGEKILICGQHSKSEQWKHRSKPEIWLNGLVKNIRSYTDRKILLRPHPRDYEWVQFLPKLDIEICLPEKIANTYDDFDHQKDFDNAYCVFSPSGNTGLQAIIDGIPVFCDNDSLAYPVANKTLDKILNPELPERNKWLVKICHTEWTLEEIEQGIPIERLFIKT